MPNSIQQHQSHTNFQDALRTEELLGRAKSDTVVLEESREWFGNCLPCVAGRREFNLGRYEVAIARRETVTSVFETFRKQLSNYEKVACLFVFNDERFYEGRADAHSAFRFLAGQMQPLTTTPAERLVDGAALTTAIALKCPVTGVQTVFDDFECIAFCPQSHDQDDPLYDPLMSAPYPSVNMSSDVFAFSLFVRDTAHILLNSEIASVRDISILAPFFDVCINRWHKIASRTIRNFQAITDTSKCPVHITADGDHWLAAHQDPAFAETAKVAHLHELPNIYARRVVARWLRHFEGIETYQAGGLAYAGFEPSPQHHHLKEERFT